MDSISTFDIVLEKDVYYSGDKINGTLIIETFESIKIRGFQTHDDKIMIKCINRNTSVS